MSTRRRHFYIRRGFQADSGVTELLRSTPTSGLLAALPTPLEQLRLPSALSGRNGSNRAPTTATRIAATDDLAAVTAWLARYADSAATLQTYRREVERLILWAVLQLGKPLSSLTHEDLLAYERFLADPQPAARWVLTGSKKLARSHPDWRPFAGPLSPGKGAPVHGHPECLLRLAHRSRLPGWQSARAGPPPARAHQAAHHALPEP
ncbi:hypothetical protein D9M68_104210 [compost metagenome]